MTDFTLYVVLLVVALAMQWPWWAVLIAVIGMLVAAPKRVPRP